MKVTGLETTSASKWLVVSLGPGSNTCRELVGTFLQAFAGNSSRVVQEKQHAWLQHNPYLMESSRGGETGHCVGLRRLLGMDHSCSDLDLIFAMHTYISIVLKWMAMEVLERFGTVSRSTGHISLMESHRVRDFMEKIEDDKLFQDYHVQGMLEGLSCFSWYIDAWDDGFSAPIRQIGKIIHARGFLPGLHEPDLLSDFLASFIPASIKRRTGQIYTPYLLSRRIVSLIEREPSPTNRVLEPACGTGSFILALLDRMLTSQGDGAIREDFAEHACKSMTGFEMSPLSAYAARINFLAVLMDHGAMDTTIHFPIHARDALGLFLDGNVDTSKLEGERFNTIIGNPPWINWEYLPQGVKEKASKAWNGYGLERAKGMRATLGNAKYDLSTLFTYACIDNYLVNEGRILFILPANLLKSTPGRGFRQFHYMNGAEMINVRVTNVHDLSACRLFKSISIPSIILDATKGMKTLFPVACFEWDQESLELTQRGNENQFGRSTMGNWCYTPLHHADRSSPLIKVKDIRVLEPLREKVFKGSSYHAREGANTEGFNAVYWIRDLEPRAGNLVAFENYTRRQRKKVASDFQHPIEKELIQPLIRSGTLSRWNAFTDTYLIFTGKHLNGGVLCDEDFFSQRYPNAYAYFCRFKQPLLNRKSYQGKSSNYPFYIMYGSNEMLNPYKVAWNRMNRDINAAVICPVVDPVLGNVVQVPQETISFVPASSILEAHYLCGMLNSKPFKHLAAFTREAGTKGFGSPRILEEITIPRFTEENPLHGKLAGHSLMAHRHFGHETIEEIEKRVDKVAAKIFDIPGHVWDSIH